MLKYCGRTLREESPDLSFNISYSDKVFRIDFHDCPSRRFLLSNGLKNYGDYCDHCMGWTRPMLGEAGYVINHEHNYKGQCWWEIRPAGARGGRASVREVAGEKDVRLWSEWLKDPAKVDRYNKANDPDQKLT